MLKLDQLPFAARIHSQARPAQHLTWDSREAGPDTAFVALDGAKMHGNAFIAQALAQGAPFILTDQDVSRAVRVPDARAALYAWARHQRRLNGLVVGITGTAGKTTAKSYAAAALEARAMPVFNTPNAIACFLVEFGAAPRPLVIELGIDHVGEMAELLALTQPDVGVVTSIGAAHLEALGDVDTVAREKGLIVQGREGLVSQQASAWFAGVPTYGFEEAIYAGEKLRLDSEQASFTFRGIGVTLPRASRVQAEAAVLGLALAERQGLDVAAAAQRLREVEVPPGRYRVLPGRVTLIDDTYNASPLSVRAALDALSRFPGRRISVLGRMLELGPREAELHAEVGRVARERADLSYGVGEYAAELGERAFADTQALTAALKEELQPGDVVLLKASRGLSMTPQERSLAGVGLDSVLRDLQAWLAQ